MNGFPQKDRISTGREGGWAGGRAPTPSLAVVIILSSLVHLHCRVVPSQANRPGECSAATGARQTVESSLKFSSSSCSSFIWCWKSSVKVFQFRKSRDLPDWTHQRRSSSSSFYDPNIQSGLNQSNGIPLVKRKVFPAKEFLLRSNHWNSSQSGWNSLSVARSSQGKVSMQNKVSLAHLHVLLLHLSPGMRMRASPATHELLSTSTWQSCEFNNNFNSRRTLTRHSHPLTHWEHMPGISSDATKATDCLCVIESVIDWP